MQRFVWSFFAVMLLSSLGVAETRSTHEKIFAPDYLVSEQLIHLNLDKKRPLLLKAAPRKSSSPIDKSDVELKNDSKRSVVLLRTQSDVQALQPELQQAIYKSIKGKKNLNNYIIFANFVHERPGAKKSEFFVAIIDKNVQVEKVALQLQWFGQGQGGGSQLRFVLDRPFIAIPQMSDQYIPQQVEWAGKGDLVYSLQALAKSSNQKRANPLLGLLGEYGSALQMASTQAIARQQITQSVVKEYEILRLSKKDKKYLLLTSLDRSNQRQEASIYNSVFNNPITETLSVLKALAKYNSNTPFKNIDTTWFNPHSLFERLSQVHPGGLQLTGSLNDQFGYLVENKPLAMEQIRQQASFKIVQKYRRDILRKPAFEKVIEHMALFALAKGITSSQVEKFWSEAGKRRPRLSGDALLFVTETKKVWRKHFPYETFTNFLEALKVVQTHTEA